MNKKKRARGGGQWEKGQDGEGGRELSQTAASGYLLGTVKMRKASAFLIWWWGLGVLILGLLFIVASMRVRRQDTDFQELAVSGTRASSKVLCRVRHLESQQAHTWTTQKYVKENQKISLSVSMQQWERRYRVTSCHQGGLAENEVSNWWLLRQEPWKCSPASGYFWHVHVRSDTWKSEWTTKTN